MLHPDKIFGRLGNRLFQMAFAYAYARENAMDYYFQDEQFFKKYSHEIKALFGDNIPTRTDMVAIHVRRGDYVKNKFYVDLMETTYYEDAMAQFPGEEFLVFSDDIGWCMQQPIFMGCEFSNEKDELKDLNLMASCKGHIIANSSFSWWGAYLSPYSEKIVAPKAWYADGINRTKVPDSWLVI